MLKPFGVAFFVLCMVWFGAILITTDPQERIDRACTPVLLADRAMSSSMQLINESWGVSTHNAFEDVHFGCRFVVWRVFYEQDWNKAQAASLPSATHEPTPQGQGPRLPASAVRRIASSPGQ